MTYSNSVSVFLSAGPVARDDAYDIDHGHMLTVDASDGVLWNDDLNGAGSPIITVTVLPSSGSLIMNTDGSLVFVPQAGYTGLVSFKYTFTVGLQPSK